MSLVGQFYCLIYTLPQRLCTSSFFPPPPSYSPLSWYFFHRYHPRAIAPSPWHAQRCPQHCPAGCCLHIQEWWNIFSVSTFVSAICAGHLYTFTPWTGTFFWNQEPLHKSTCPSLSGSFGQGSLKRRLLPCGWNKLGLCCELHLSLRVYFDLR